MWNLRQPQSALLVRSDTIQALSIFISKYCIFLSRQSETRSGCRRQNSQLRSTRVWPMVQVQSHRPLPAAKDSNRSYLAPSVGNGSKCYSPFIRVKRSDILPSLSNFHGMDWSGDQKLPLHTQPPSVNTVKALKGWNAIEIYHVRTVWRETRHQHAHTFTQTFETRPHRSKKVLVRARRTLRVRYSISRTWYFLWWIERTETLRQPLRVNSN
jgi:hypothetical protein